MAAGIRLQKAEAQCLSADLPGMRQLMRAGPRIFALSGCIGRTRDFPMAKLIPGPLTLEQLKNGRKASGVRNFTYALRLPLHKWQSAKGVNMWIRLTRADGNTITVNTDYLVSIQDHGDRTLIVHTCGEVLVQESQLALFEALRLQPIARGGQKPDRRAELH